MINIKKFYNQFKLLNPKYTNIKLGAIIVLLLGLFFRGIVNFEFSWELVISLGVFLISMTLHEVAHGYVAYKFGDDTAKNEGRLTLNPLKHLDLTGMILPLLLILSGSNFLIGWAKPVPVMFNRLKPNRLGLFCVSIAGIVVNFIIALFAGIGIKIFLNTNGNMQNGIIFEILLYTYLINLAMAFFNLIPVTPLDGGRIVHSLSGEKVREFYNQIEKYGILIVFVIVYTGIFSNVFMEILKFFLNIVGISGII